jgi:hypothetical protein
VVVAPDENQTKLLLDTSPAACSAEVQAALVIAEDVV